MNALCVIKAVRGYKQEPDCDKRIKLIAIKNVPEL